MTPEINWLPEARIYIEQISDAPDFREKVTSVIAGWMTRAAEENRNAAFYRSLLEQCATHLGPAAYIADDGSVMDSPLLLKIPELVEKLAKNQTTKDKIIAEMLALSPEERRQCKDALKEHFCWDCGNAHPEGRTCQCWNDD